MLPALTIQRKYVTVTGVYAGENAALSRTGAKTASVTVKYFVPLPDGIMMPYVEILSQETRMRLTSVRTMSAIAFIGGSLLALPQANADDVKLSGFPSLILSGGAAEATSHSIPKPFKNLVKADTLEVGFGRTTLDEIQKQFGGEIRTRGAGTDATSWLCYQVALDGHASNLWFISNGEGSGSKRLLTMVTAEESDTARSGCSQGPETLTDWMLPVPGLKDGEQNLQDAFGASVNDGIIRYSNETGPDNKGFMTLQALVYRLKDGKIDGMSFSQITTK
jgi:hypothetical protein